MKSNWIMAVHLLVIFLVLCTKRKCLVAKFLAFFPNGAGASSIPSRELFKLSFSPMTMSVHRNVAKTLSVYEWTWMTIGVFALSKCR